jgi:recombination protein RecA
MATELGIMEKSGAWFYYDGSRIGQGKDNARAFIEGDPALMAELEEKIKEKGAAVLDRDENNEDDDDEELDIRLLDLDDDEADGE